MSLSQFAADLVIDVIRTNATHVALFTANPIAAGDLDDEQADANGYGRAAITWTDSGDEDDENTADVEFTADGAAWTGPWYVALMDSGTHGAGNVIAIAVDESGDPATTTATELADGDTLKFAAGGLVASAALGG